MSGESKEASDYCVQVFQSQTCPYRKSFGNNRSCGCQWKDGNCGDSGHSYTCMTNVFKKSNSTLPGCIKDSDAALKYYNQSTDYGNSMYTLFTTEYSQCGDGGTTHGYEMKAAWGGNGTSTTPYAGLGSTKCNWISKYPDCVSDPCGQGSNTLQQAGNSGCDSTDGYNACRINIFDKKLKSDIRADPNPQPAEGTTPYPSTTLNGTGAVSNNGGTVYYTGFNSAPSIMSCPSAASIINPSFDANSLENYMQPPDQDICTDTHSGDWPCQAEITPAQMKWYTVPTNSDKWNVNFGNKKYCNVDIHYYDNQDFDQAPSSYLMDNIYKDASKPLVAFVNRRPVGLLYQSNSASPNPFPSDSTFTAGTQPTNDRYAPSNGVSFLKFPIGNYQFMHSGDSTKNPMSIASTSSPSNHNVFALKLGASPSYNNMTCPNIPTTGGKISVDPVMYLNNSSSPPWSNQNGEVYNLSNPQFISPAIPSEMPTYKYETLEGTAKNTVAGSVSCEYAVDNLQQAYDMHQYIGNLSG